MCPPLAGGLSQPPLQRPSLQRRGYAQNWDEFKKRNRLLLFGNVGAGKSYAAGCIANALIDRLSLSSLWECPMWSTVCKATSARAATIT